MKKTELSEIRSCVKEVDDLAWAPALNSPYGLCGRKATLKKKKKK